MYKDNLLSVDILTLSTVNNIGKQDWIAYVQFYSSTLRGSNVRVRNSGTLLKIFIQLK